MSEIIVNRLREAILNLDDEKARQIAAEGVSAGLDPLQMINDGIRRALELMGENFASGSLFLPELMLAAQAADAAVAVLEPELVRRGSSQKKLAKVLLATVEGDIHDIGKNIVGLVMKSSGLDVVDIGVDRKKEDIVAAAEEHRVDVIGLSALLTTTMPRMPEIVELLQESGLRDRYKVIIGGAPVTAEFAEKIGADGYSADAPASVALTKRLIGA